MSRLAPKELSSKPCLSNAARHVRTNSSETTGYVGSTCEATISMPGPMPSSATRSSRPSKSNQPARNSALAEYSVRPSLNGSASVAGGRRRNIPDERRGCGIPVDDRQVAYVVDDVRDVHAGSAVLARRDLHVRQPQLAVQHDVVLFAEGDGMLSLHDQQRVLLQVPQHLALLRKLGERVPPTAELEREVLFVHAVRRRS